MLTAYILTQNGSFISENELYHHGIKGMKWGVRRYQNEDGSLTSAGKKRYYDTPELNAQKTAMNNARAKYKSSVSEYDRAYTRYDYNPTSKNRRAMNEAEAKMKADRSTYQMSKLNYSTNKEAARIKSKGIEIKNKSKHRQKLEEQYKKLGMSDEQAQAAANKRVRTERILAASAALTVAACAAYAGVKYRQDRIDGIIKAGENLQRIEMQDTGGKLHDVFYVAKGKHDEARYAGLLGMTRQRQTGQAFMMKLEASGDIKVASKKNAEKVFGDLYKNDPEFRRNARQYASKHFTGVNQIDPNKMSRRNIAKMYENFNANLIDVRNGGSGVDKKFYNALKKAGYGAIQDINDMKYSGYHAKNPLIVFDNSNNNIMVKSVSRMQGNLAKAGNKEATKAAVESMVDDLAKKVGIGSAVGLTGAAVKTYRSDPTKMYSEAVNSYKKEHPGTKMSDQEIYKMLNSQK